MGTPDVRHSGIDMPHLIATRRDGGVHSREELFDLARAAAQGTAPDYQLSAWLMAAFFKPLSLQETAWLTEAMAASGERMDLSGLPKPWVDKHSTGGVGDKTTLALLPILSACGLTVVKMSGRGLGVTGGTIDKLSSIPGFRTNLSPDEMKAQAQRIGLALTGQTPNLAPADKALYALRDTTGTVGSIPLIVSSVLSKKLAGGAETIVLDVKCGSGALVETEPEARELASMLTAVARLLNLNVRAALTDMAQPLGSALGNALEVREAVRMLRQDPPTPQEQRFRSLCLQLAGITLAASGLAPTVAAGTGMAERSVRSGAALDKAREWFEAQGASADVTEDLNLLPRAQVVKELTNPYGDGWVSRADAQTIGRGVVRLGGGRKRKEDQIDVSVGIEMRCHVGERVAQGQPLCTVHAADEAAAELVAGRVLQAFEIVPEPVEERPLIFEVF